MIDQIDHLKEGAMKLLVAYELADGGRPHGAKERIEYAKAEALLAIAQALRKPRVIVLGHNDEGNGEDRTGTLLNIRKSADGVFDAIVVLDDDTIGVFGLQRVIVDRKEKSPRSS